MPLVVTQILAERRGITERELIVSELHATHWTPAEVAKRLNVVVKTIYTRMEALGIPTSEELTAFWYDGHLLTLGGHARRLGVHTNRARQRYRNGHQLEVVFSNELMTRGRHGRGSRGVPDRGADHRAVGVLAVPTAGAPGAGAKK